MRTNKEVAQDFARIANGTTDRTESHANSLQVFKASNGVVELKSYNTTIAAYFPESKTLILNRTYYSNTTSGKHQSQFAHVCNTYYNSIVEVDNIKFNATASDLKKAAEFVNRYTVEPSRYGVEGWEVFDNLNGYTVKHYEKKHYAEVYASKLNEAQKPRA